MRRYELGALKRVQGGMVTAVVRNYFPLLSDTIELIFILSDFQTFV